MTDIARKKDISTWWSENPMTYGRQHGKVAYDEDSGMREPEFCSPEFFAKVDQTFFSWNHPLHDATGHFGRVFPYASYRGKRVLEIGCGMGTMSMLWANSGALMYPVDLNPSAVTATTKRFQLLGLTPRVARADGNVVPFPNQAFDYAYSWGVLHHSPDLDRSVAEMFRVLRPGGGFGVMLYHRDSWLYNYHVRFKEGFLHGESQHLSELQLASRYGDGDRDEGNPHTWPVTKPEMFQLFGQYSDDIGIRVLGAELDLELNIAFPGVDRFIPRALLKPWARRFGWSLWMHGHKRA